MRSLSLSALALVAFLLCSALPIAAQTEPNLEAGMKPFGSYEGGNFDSVSLTNGNLNVRIPLFAYPQRGSLPVHFSFQYNNKGYQVHQYCGPRTGNCSSFWYWAGFSQGGPAVGLELPDAVNISKTVLHNGTAVTALTSDGSSHQMGLLSAAGQYESVDGSGIF